MKIPSVRGFFCWNGGAYEKGFKIFLGVGIIDHFRSRGSGALRYDNSLRLDGDAGRKPGGNAKALVFSPI